MRKLEIKELKQQNQAWAFYLPTLLFPPPPFLEPHNIKDLQYARNWVKSYLHIFLYVHIYIRYIIIESSFYRASMADGELETNLIFQLNPIPLCSQTAENQPMSLH